MLLLLIAACSNESASTGADNGITTPTAAVETAPAATKPSGPPAGPFSLAISPYPSWTTYDVAVNLGLIDGKEGALGEIERKWNVDIVLKSEQDYVMTLQMFDNSSVDAVAVTNTDALGLVDKRNGVAVLATSTSFGADAFIVDNDVKGWDDLRKREIRGAVQSVSDYLLFRCAQKAGVNWQDFPMQNLDPLLAGSKVLGQPPGDKIAVVLWNPATMNVLEGRQDVNSFCTSADFPGEIVDMVVAGADTLEKPGADAFAKAVIDTYYAVNERLADPDQARANDVLIQLGEQFSKITDPEVMRRLTRETKFYATPDQGIAAYGSQTFADAWAHIAEFSTTHGLVTTVPTVVNGHDAPAPATGMWLRVDTSYMEAVGNN